MAGVERRAVEAEAAAAEALLDDALDEAARSGALPLDRLPQVQQARAEAEELRAEADELHSRLWAALDGRSQLEARLAKVRARG